MGSIRMARPALRRGSQYKQLRSRIPRDVRDLVRGTTLYIPIGDAVDKVQVGAQAIEITRSLRTTNKAEAIARNAAALSYLENVYSFHRCAKPVSLSRKQCAALRPALCGARRSALGGQRFASNADIKLSASTNGLV